MNKETELLNVKSGKGYLSKIYAIAEENRKITLIMFFLLILVVYQGLALVKIKQELVLSVDIPERTYYDGTIHIAEDRANPLFYKLWGAYLVKDIIGNYNHRNVKHNYTYLLENLSPEKVSTYAPSIKSKVKRTIKQLITHSYNEGKIETKGDNYSFTYISHGKGYKKIGEVEEFAESCTYELDMSVKSFKLKVDRVYEKCIKEVKK